MEGNSITSFENLCRIFEMRIKLDKEKGVKTSLDVFNNYEKYSKKIDSIYNSEFQKELKPLISPAVTLEKEEDRLRRLIRLLEERLDRRIELEDRFYNATGKYISGLQIIVSESELEEKKGRLSLVSNYLETSKEIESVTESLDKLRDSLADEEGKKKEYEDKNKLMEDELYSTFMSVIKEDEYYKNVNEEDINNLLDQIRSKVSETEETLDITKESVGSLITSGLEDDYSSYVEEAERSYFTYKNREIILKIYKLVMNFEEDFKLMCAKREKISELIEERKELRNSLSIETEDDLLVFEDTLLLQIKTLDNEREVLENIINYTSRIKFKEERLEELNDINSSSDTLVILREYGLVDTYDTEDISCDILEDDSLDEPLDIELQEEHVEKPVSETVYDPCRIVEVKDYPKSLNVGLAKLKGASVRDKVNKKLNPNLMVEFGDVKLPLEEKEDVVSSVIVDNNNFEDVSSKEENTFNEDEVRIDNPVNTPVWEIPTELEPKSVQLEEHNDLPIEEHNDLPMWEMVEPSFENTQLLDKEEISSIDITSSSDEENNNNNNMFWIPVSDSKLEAKDFSNMNIPISSNLNGNDGFTFPSIDN